MRARYTHRQRAERIWRDWYRDGPPAVPDEGRVLRLIEAAYTQGYESGCAKMRARQRRGAR